MKKLIMYLLIMSFTPSLPDNSYHSDNEQFIIKFKVPDNIYQRSQFLDNHEYIKFKYQNKFYMIDKYQLIYSFYNRKSLLGSYNHRTQELLVED